MQTNGLAVYFLVSVTWPFSTLFFNQHKTARFDFCFLHLHRAVQYHHSLTHPFNSHYILTTMCKHYRHNAKARHERELSAAKSKLGRTAPVTRVAVGKTAAGKKFRFLLRHPRKGKSKSESKVLKQAQQAAEMSEDVEMSDDTDMDDLARAFAKMALGQNGIEGPESNDVEMEMFSTPSSKTMFLAPSHPIILHHTNDFFRKAAPEWKRKVDPLERGTRNERDAKRFRGPEAPKPKGPYRVFYGNIAILKMPNGSSRTLRWDTNRQSRLRR